MRTFKALFRPIKEFATAEPIAFSRDLVLENVSFQYQSSGTTVLSNVNLKIRKREKCAFVGTTGCGKSTLIDIMVGLLQPQSGRLLVDSLEITPENVYGWQTKIAYVPQDVFLYDDTIAGNIALGVPPQLIDQVRLKKAARLAQVDEFIDSEFREGFDTFVGERGIRLSGGQRQRIGLARAFYRQPDVLFLDEATSALDSVTEEAIISAIEKELPDLTLILISHRLASTRFCDRIFFVDRGQIVDSGTYENLLKTSYAFRQMVDVNE